MTPHDPNNKRLIPIDEYSRIVKGRRQRVRSHFRGWPRR